MSAKPGDLVAVYDARDLSGSMRRIGVGVFVGSCGIRSGEPFEEVRIVVGDKTLSGPFTAVVLQRANFSTT